MKRSIRTGVAALAVAASLAATTPAAAAAPVFPEPGTFCQRVRPGHTNQGGCVAQLAAQNITPAAANWCRIGYRTSPPWTGPFETHGECVRAFNGNSTS